MRREKHKFKSIRNGDYVTAPEISACKGCVHMAKECGGARGDYCFKNRCIWIYWPIDGVNQ